MNPPLKSLSKFLKEKIKLLPDRPGVYLMKDGSGRVIYIGKAASLKKRVRSYFPARHRYAQALAGGPADSPKTSAIVKRLADIDCLVANSELEALILESNLIKKYRPRYNIILRDDKQYPYLKLTFNEKWPRLLLTRKIEKDGARYFGPFSAGMVRQTLKTVKRLFPIRSCQESPLKERRQPCLYYHMKRCPGPCLGKIDHKTYLKLCQEIALLIEGRLMTAAESLRAEMEGAAEREEFEKAAALRDRVLSLEKMAEGQRVVLTDLKDKDVWAIAASSGRALVLIFQIREGKLIGRENYYLENTRGAVPREILGAGFVQYYTSATFVPSEIILPFKTEGHSLAQSWLARFKILTPKGGQGNDLLKMAAENARLLLEQKLLFEAGTPGQMLLALKKGLALAGLPLRIEGFDVSNILGADAVGSLVVFEGGRPLKSDYRRFKVKLKKVPDDVAAIYEIVKRRYAGSLRKELPEPDLILVDGGVGQARAAERALKESKLTVPVLALAKRQEEIYFPGSGRPRRLFSRSKGLRLLKQVRDEAHRFALGYHRTRRKIKLLSEIASRRPLC